MTKTLPIYCVRAIYILCTTDTLITRLLVYVVNCVNIILIILPVLSRNIKASGGNHLTHRRLSEVSYIPGSNY